MQGFQAFFGFLALADVEHEADEGLNLAILVTYHMNHVANPYVLAVGSKCPVVGFVIGSGLGLGYAEVHYPLAVLRMHAVGPVVGADPAVLCPAQQVFDLRADVGEGHGLPVDLPGNGLG